MKIILITILLLISPVLVFATDPPIQLYDEGVLVGTIYKIDCVGSTITCTKNGITGTITIGSSVSGSLQFLGNDLTFNGNSLTFNP